MATVRWRGDAPTTAQVQAYVIDGTWESGDLIICTIGAKSFTYTTSSTNTTTIAAGLVTAWNALSGTTYPEFAELTASNSTNTFKLTADTAGKPMGTITLSTTESGGGAADGQTIDGVTSSTGTTSTANKGPNDWNSPMNWSGGAVPVDTDDIVIQDSDVDILYGLDQSAIQPTSLTIDMSYTGKIGLPAINEDSSSGSYYEYRDRYLKIEPVTTNIGRGSGAGSGRINLNTNDDAVTVNVFNTGVAESGRERALQLLGTNAANVLNIVKGSVGVAIEAGETAQIATLRIGYLDNVSGDSQVRTGAGLTLATVSMAGGVVTLGCAATTITQDEGELTLDGTGAIATLKVRGGTCHYNTTGTLTTGTVSGAGHLDFSQDLRSKTVTNAIERYGPQAKISDPHKVVSSLVIDNNETSDISALNIGTDFKLTRAATT
jgi:hypothetical protein